MAQKPSERSIKDRTEQRAVDASEKIKNILGKAESTLPLGEWYLGG